MTRSQVDSCLEWEKVEMWSMGCCEGYGEGGTGVALGNNEGLVRVGEGAVTAMVRVRRGWH